MDAKHKKCQDQHFESKIRWKHSINQFSKLQEETKLCVLDSREKKVCSLKFKMKNRLAQIDEQFIPFLFQRKDNEKIKPDKVKGKLASTNHCTNILSLQSDGNNLNLQQSILILNPESLDDGSKPFKSFKYKGFSEKIVEQLTQYNRSKYENEMKQHCTKYNQSVKSVFYSIINYAKKQMYEFCYICDEIVQGKQNITHLTKQQTHICKKPLDSLQRVHQALKKMESYVSHQNNKIFNVFLHNTMQHQVEVEQLIGNVRVLKQSLELEYEPEEAVLRMRLMNLIGKKIGLLLQQNDLQDRLMNII